MQSPGRFAGILLALLLGGCQGQPPPADRAASAVRSQPAAQSTPLPVLPDSGAAVATLLEKQTLFPDSLRPIELPVQYWTGPQVDSIKAAMQEADSLEPNKHIAASRVDLWTDRCRVLLSDEYSGERRLFFRTPGVAHWVELDLNSWMGGYNSLPYLNARAVELDQRPPEELMVELGGGFAGQGQREMEDHTLLVSFDGPPRIIWHSLDGLTEEISPTYAAKDGEMLGGNYADARRKITVRRGCVQVGRVQQEGNFESGLESGLTPITPGSYAYRAGRFRRVRP